MPLPTKADNNVLDVYIGDRIRRRRLELKLEVADLACSIGVDPCEIEEYESGRKRIAVDYLFDLADALEVGIGYFYGV